MTLGPAGQLLLTRQRRARSLQCASCVLAGSNAKGHADYGACLLPVPANRVSVWIVLMREGDNLYFAPGIRFGEVVLEGPSLAGQYRARIDGFYLQPARMCIDQGYAFAAGLLLVSTIDFMAGFHHPAERDELPERPVGAEFREFVTSQLRSFPSDQLAKRLFKEFRNGLSHEARIKNGGEFSFGLKQTVCLLGGRLCINPDYLLREVEDALARQMAELAENAAKRRHAAERLRRLFWKEFGIVRRERRAS